MGDENPIRTLGDYSKPSHRNERAYTITIELPVRNNCGTLLRPDQSIRYIFPPGRMAELRNNILMFQQRQDESLYDAWNHFKDLLLKRSLIKGLDYGLQVNLYDHVDYNHQMALTMAAAET
ncbi:hypothetical protein Tco_1546550 [Tanacetum coccineum]